MSLSVAKASSIDSNRVSFVGDFSFVASVRDWAIEENVGINCLTSPNKILAAFLF